LGTLEQAADDFPGYIDYYNVIRLPCAIGYVTPCDMLCSRKEKIVAERGKDGSGQGKQAWAGGRMKSGR
jgi:hypothetical protein